jgi:DNA-directed RNA polymerase
MIPLRIVSRARLAPSPLPSRLSAVRQARPFTSPTVSRSRPSAQLAEIENDSPEPYYHHGPSSSSEPLPRSPQPVRVARRIQLPSPLPSDVIPEANAAQSTLYPSTGVIDSISMISICLRRPEHVPRAYQIFKQLLEDSRTGVRTLPDAEVWGRVIEGVAALGRKGLGEALVYQNWRQRAQKLVCWWEAACGVEEQQGIAAGLERGGYQVYQGWLAGMVQ